MNLFGDLKYYLFLGKLGCPEGWVNGATESLGCLKFVTDSTPASYTASKTLCASNENSYPVEIESQSQQTFIRNYASHLVTNGTISGTHGWWIGK